jgi:hypothetical protein
MAYYDHAKGRSPVMRLWFQAVGEASDQEVREIVAGTLGDAVEVIASIIRAGQATGDFSGEVDARADAWRFMGIGLSMDVAAVLGFDADLTREAVQRWGDSFIDSLRERKETRND